MRTAVCLAGQARFISENADNILHNLIKPTNADVFCYFWDTEGENLEPKKAIEVFNPTSFLLETQKIFDTAAQEFVSSEYDFPSNRCQNLYSMHYSIFKANSLKKAQEIEQGFVYDCVIRSRTDIAFEEPFDFSEYNQDSDSIWLCNFDKSPAGGVACADLFAFSKSPQMDFYSSCFTNLPRLLAEHKHLFAETLLYNYLTPVHNLKLSKMRYTVVRH